MSYLKPPALWFDRLPTFLKKYLKERPAASKFASNSLWLLLDKLIRLVLALTVGAWVARHLGPHAFGELAYAITFIALFQGIANLGLDGIVVRDLARNPSEAAEILGTTFRLRLLAGLLCWLVAIALIWILRPGDSSALLLIAIIGASLVFQSTDTIDLWFQGQGKNHKSVISKLISYTLANSMRVAFVALNAPLWTYAFAALLDAAFLAVALTNTYRKFPTTTDWSFSKRRSNELLSQSWPFMISGLAALIYMRIDQIMIREMLGEAQLGIYMAAISASQMWNSIPVIISTALAPYIAQTKKQSNDKYMKALYRVFRIFAGTSITISIIVCLFSHEIIRVLYGPSYNTSITILMIHIFSNIFIFMGVAQGLWLINEGLGKITLYKTALGAIASIIGNTILIPQFGLYGAATSTLISMFTAAIASNIVFAPKIFTLQLRALLLIKKYQN